MFSVPLAIPPEVISSWPKPNYTNPVIRNDGYWFATSIFLFAATVSVCMRLWTRIYLRRWFGLDDLLILVAFLFTVGVTTTASLGTGRYAWNRHLWDYPLQHVKASMTTLYFCRIFWGLATSLVRLSVLCLYYRLVKFCNAPRYFHWVLHVIAAITVIMLLYYLFAGIFPCIPIRAYWTWPVMTDAKCFNDATSVEAAAIINTLSEFILATLPLLAVVPLRVDKRKRWAATSLLSLGFVVAFTGCFRCFYIWKMMSTNDLTWWAEPQWICSQVEIDLALMCACASPTRPLFARIARRFRGAKPFNQVSHLVPTSYSSRGINPAVTSSTRRDLEEVAEWSNIVARAIDLDGIANDGLGYTVTISGPPREKRKLKKKPGASMATMTAQQRKQSVQSMSEDGKPAFEIPVKTEVSIHETWHSGPLGRRATFWDPKVSSENTVSANFEADSGQPDLEFLGNPNMLSHVEPVLDGVPPMHVEDFRGCDSVEGVEALPAIPPRTTHPPGGS